MNKHKTIRLLLRKTGIILIVTSIILLLLAKIYYWRQERINKWAIEIPLDMGNTNTYSKSFTPETPYYACHTRFIMLQPVTDEFASYRSRGGGNVPDELIRNKFSQMPFKVSWRLFDEEKEVCSGVFQNTNINAFVYPDYVLYTFSHYSIKGNRNLEAGKKYSFICDIEQSSEPLNKLNPKIEFRRGASFKARGLSRRALFTIFPILIFGVILLYISDIKKVQNKNIDVLNEL